MVNHPNRKLSKVAQAYERCKIARKALREHACSMEVTEDKCGIVWERWCIVVDGRSMSLILFATPSWYEVFRPLTDDQRNEAIPEALAALVFTRVA